MNQEFVADPIVPVELRLGGKQYVTLYQPGWHIEEGASPFPGGPGTVHVFGSLDDLGTYAASDAVTGLGDNAYLDTVRGWTIDDYTERLCAYDLANPSELSDRTLHEHEQLSLGSTLALLLDLLDQLEVDDPHADSLRDDPAIGQLASGDLLGGMFGSAKQRKQVIELISSHLPWSVAEISRRVSVPDVSGLSRAERSGDADASDSGAESGGVMLEDVVDAITLWFGLTDSGVYTIRTTSLAGRSPRYPGAKGATGGHQLTAWTSLEDLAAELPKVAQELDEPSFAGLDGIEVDLTPGDELIFDLVQLGEAIGPRLTVEQADQLVTAWAEIVRLAAWGEWRDVSALTSPEAPIGAFVVAAAIDRAQDRPGAKQALVTAEVTQARADWTALVQAIEQHLSLSRP